MRKLGYVSLLTIIVAVTVIVIGSRFSVAASIQPEDYGLPAKLKSLTDLKPVLERKDMTSVQKTDVLVFWLGEERRQPTPSFKGLAGGDINSSYIQAQIIKALCEVGNPLALGTIDSDENAAPDIRDGARLALGLMGDSTQISKLMGIIENQSEPYFRVTAAEALGSLGATAAIPALERALRDEYTVTGGGCTPTGPSTIYPVREAAQTALRVLNMPESELKRHVQEKTARFEQRVREAASDTQ